MRQPWLAFLSIGVIGGIVLLLFALRLRPAWTPKSNAASGVPAISAPVVTFVDPSVGPINAKVTIVEYGDFLCGACADASATAQAVQTAFPKDVRLAWKHMPNDSLHPLATAASIAAQCAQRQDKFWAYANLLFARQSTLSTDQFPEIGQEAGLNGPAFQACLDAQDTLPVVQKDEQEGLGLQIAATPTIFINGQRYVGAMSVQELTGYVQTILAK